MSFARGIMPRTSTPKEQHGWAPYLHNSGRVDIPDISIAPARVLRRSPNVANNVSMHALICIVCTRRIAEGQGAARLEHRRLALPTFMCIVPGQEEGLTHISYTEARHDTRTPNLVQERPRVIDSGQWEARIKGVVSLNMAAPGGGDTNSRAHVHSAPWIIYMIRYTQAFCRERMTV